MQTWTFQGWPQGPWAVVSVGASPFTWTNTEAVPITLFISGGTVTTVEFSRDGSTWDVIGLLGGNVATLPGDKVRITYLLTPAVIAYPL